MTALVISISSVLSGWALTGLLRKYALRRNILDRPNERSSHSVPTPRGGGVAIVITYLAGILFFPFLEVGTTPILLAYGGAGTLVALVGFADDHRHIPAQWRLVVHFVAAVWLLHWLIPDLNWSLVTIASVLLVWLLNLYNFMDGIDGIAGVEAVTVCFGGIVLANATDSMEVAWIAPMLLGGAVLGFLVWNFPKALIFMGDAGSGFIGIILGAFAVQAATISLVLFWGWVILFGCFIIDATVTLIRRMLSGQKVYRAHRSHAYQFAARRYGSHVPVTLVFAGVNLFWLLPIAILLVKGNVTPLVAVVIAWAPLIVAVLYFRAGSAEH